MIRYLAIGLLACSAAAIGGEPRAYNKTDTFCQEAKGLSNITSQLPDYPLSSNVETSAAVVGPMTFKPFELLSAARGQPVCIAVVVSETGIVQDAAVYFPKRVALSKVERNQLLAIRYTPAMQSGVPTKSIVLMKAWSD